MSPSEEEHEPGGSRLDRLLEPFFSDCTLFPVTIAAVAILVTFGASLLVLAGRARNGFAIAALVIVAWVSADAVRHDVARRRLGPASGFILTLWGLSAAAAAAAVYSGYF